MSSYDPLSNLNISSFSERDVHLRVPSSKMSLSSCRPRCVWHTSLLSRVRKSRIPEEKQFVQSFVVANISRNLSYYAQVSNRLWIRCQDIRVFMDFHIFQVVANHWSDNDIIEGLCDTLGSVTRSFAFSVNISISWSSQLTYLCSDSSWNVFSCTAGSSCHELDSCVRLPADVIYLSKSLTTVEDSRSHCQINVNTDSWTSRVLIIVVRRIWRDSFRCSSDVVLALWWHLRRPCHLWFPRRSVSRAQDTSYRFLWVGQRITNEKSSRRLSSIIHTTFFFSRDPKVTSWVDVKSLFFFFSPRDQSRHGSVSPWGRLVNSSIFLNHYWDVLQNVTWRKLELESIGTCWRDQSTSRFVFDFVLFARTESSRLYSYATTEGTMCPIPWRVRECAPATDRIVSAIFPFIHDVNVISIIFLTYCDYARSSDIQCFYSNTNPVWRNFSVGYKIIWEFDVLLSFHWSQIKIIFSEMSTRSSIYEMSCYVILLTCDNKL